MKAAKRLGTATVAFVMLAMGVGSAQAHAPGVTLTGLGSATIDGTVSPGEWQAAATIAVPVNLPGGSTAAGTLLVMNDSSNLYLALRIPRYLDPGGTSLGFEFDNDHDGRWPEKGDDAFLLNPGTVQGLFDGFRHRCRTSFSAPFHIWCGEEDTISGEPADVSMPGLPPPGTTDGAGAFASDATSSVFELSHPLDSADDAHDFSLEAGDIVGFTLTLRIIGGELVDTVFPSQATGVGFGDILIATPSG